MNPSLQNQVLQFLEFCQTQAGKTVEVREAISTHADSFDRHHTTFGFTAFELQSASWRVSGGRIMLNGERLYYEIWADVILACDTLSAGEFMILEQYAPTCFRKTMLCFLA